jgi:AcrR family transcriptional regulator
MRGSIRPFVLICVAMSTPPSDLSSTRPPRRRRSDGERSRSAILNEAAQLATVEGIAGLSIAHLADAVGMSKSGLFAHFGSKEELQLATIDTASAIFSERVVDPAGSAQGGLERLRLLAEGFLGHLQDGVFPGGCFFASVAAEVDTHPGPVRDRAFHVVDGWLGQLEQAVVDGQEEGAIDASEDPRQLAFEVNSYLLLANALFVADRDPTPLQQARTALERRLADARAARKPRRSGATRRS